MATRGKAGDSKVDKVVTFPAKETSGYNALIEREKNIIGERIAEARHRKKLSLVAMGKLLSEFGLSIQRNGIFSWEKGDSVPNGYQLLAICHALNIEDGLAYFLDATPQPELNDDGLRKLAEYKADLIATGLYKPVPRSRHKAIIHISMPVSTLSVSAGTGSFLDDDAFEMVNFPASSVPAKADFGVRVSGDSMEPVYHDGQIVWVQKCETLQPGEVGVFMYDGEGYIKMYDEQEPDEDMLDNYTDSNGVVHMQAVLVSYNEKYEPKLVSPHTSFSVAGRVL